MNAAVDTITVVYHEDGQTHEPFQHLRFTTLSFAQVLERLRAAVRTADLLVLTEIDPQMILRKENYAMGEARQILFFHPRLMARLLAADTSALLEAPLKFAVVADGDVRVAVRWQDPAVAFARYGNPALTALGIELAQTYHNIVAAALA